MRTTGRKIEYHKANFILSVIGFIGSIGFYVGVLRQVYAPEKEDQKIDQLEQENRELRKRIEEMTDNTISYERGIFK